MLLLKTEMIFCPLNRPVYQIWTFCNFFCEQRMHEIDMDNVQPFTCPPPPPPRYRDMIIYNHK